MAQSPRRRGSRSAFTLIELSIVLVVIGLIVGGVLVGKDMIHAAQIRSQVSDIEKLNTAFNTFKLKYNCIPGDCKNATQFFGSASQPTQVTNGDGDSIISAYYDRGNVFDSTWFVFASISEWANVFDHLAAAGLWNINQYDETDSANNQPGLGYPKMAFYDGVTPYPGNDDYYQQGGMAVGYDPSTYYISAGNKIHLGACSFGGSSEVKFGCGMLSTSMWQIDSKIDDGLPYSGSVVLIGGNRYPYRLPGTIQDDTNWCGNLPNSYDVTDTRGSCGLAINAQF